ncbi:MAG: LysR family transcriptional regulator [Holosporales bacterium]|jgi:DNA-binding transcriptional LysR family regulator|nr:LysR family transcriptional regulator [Holosporales bacterium]
MIKNLRNFITFSEEGLDGLLIPIGAFIEQMVDLEGEIGHKLIDVINHKRIVLTPFGSIFIPHARKSLRAIEDGLISSGIANAGNCDQHLTIGIARDSITTWAINCIRNFNKLNSGLRLSIIAEDEITDNMMNNSTIIFWCVNNGLPNFDKMWYIEYKYGLYASEVYIQKHGEPSLTTMDRHKIIAYSGKDNNALLTNWHLTNDYNLPPIRPSVFSQSRDLIVKMISEGIGVGSTCDNQDVYYGYKSLRRVLKFVKGPVLRSYFMVRSGVNENVYCNVVLFNKLFREFFKIHGIDIIECDR